MIESGEAFGSKDRLLVQDYHGGGNLECHGDPSCAASRQSLCDPSRESGVSKRP